MSELGRKFKEKRESLGLSLSEASLSTKITPRMIAAIEEGDLQALPALPFAKGFVRAYASYLKMDPEEMVKIFIGEISPPEPEVPVLEVERKEEEREPSPPVDMNDESSAMKRFFIIGGVAVLIVAIVGVKSLIDKYKKEGDLPSSEEVVVSPIEKEDEADDQEDAEEEKADQAAVESDKTEAAATPAPAESTATQPSAVAVAPAPPPAVPAPTVKPTPPVAVTKPEPVKPAPTPAPASTTPPSTPPVADVAKKEAAVEKKQMEILFEALDSVQVNLSMGGQSKRISLNAGEVHILRTSEKVQMEISDGGAVNLVVNGRSRGVPGSLGQKAKVQLP